MRREVFYERIVESRVDRGGNLRLFRQRRYFFVRQAIFHPAGEWASVTIDRDANARVGLAR